MNELERKSQQLRKQSEKDTNFTKAHYLLAGSGISADDIEDELNAIHIPKLVGEYQAIVPLLVQKILKII